MNSSLEKFAFRLLTATNINTTDKSVFAVNVPSDLAGKARTAMCSIDGEWGTAGVLNSYIKNNILYIKTNVASTAVYNISFCVLFYI